MLVALKPLDRMETRVPATHKYAAILVLVIAIWGHIERMRKPTIGGWSLCFLMTHRVVLNAHRTVSRFVFGIEP